MAWALVRQAIVLTAQEPRHSRGSGVELLRIGRLCRHRLGDGVGRIHQRGTLRALTAQYLASLAHMVSNRLEIPGMCVPGVKVGDLWATVTQRGQAFRDDVLVPFPASV